MEKVFGIYEKLENSEFAKELDSIGIENILGKKGETKIMCVYGKVGKERVFEIGIKNNEVVYLIFKLDRINFNPEELKLSSKNDLEKILNYLQNIDLFRELFTVIHPDFPIKEDYNFYLEVLNREYTGEVKRTFVAYNLGFYTILGEIDNLREGYKEVLNKILNSLIDKGFIITGSGYLRKLSKRETSKPDKFEDEINSIINKWVKEVIFEYQGNSAIFVNFDKTQTLYSIILPITEEMRKNIKINNKPFVGNLKVCIWKPGSIIFKKRLGTKFFDLNIT